MKRKKRISLFILAVAIGLVIVVLVISSGKSPPVEPTSEAVYGGSEQ